MSYRLLIPFILLGSIFSVQSLEAQRWSVLEVGSGTKPALDLDGNDIPHIAYMLEASQGFVKHAELIDGSFESTTVQEAYYYGPLDIAIDPNNQPGISVHHHNIQNEITFFRDATGQWSDEAVTSDGHDGWDNSIAFDSNGFPHTSTVDPANFGSSNGIEYAWKDAQGWHKEVIGSVPVRYMFSTSIALDANDAPHIVFYATDSTYYATKSTGTWQIESVADENGRFPSIVLDADGDPHLAYYVRSSGDQGMVRYAVKKEGAWQTEDIGALNNVPLAFAGARRVTAIQIGSNGDKHVCYGDREFVKYGIKSDQQWQIDTVVDVSQSTIILGAQVDMALDSKYEPHFTYFEATSLSPLTGIVKYAQAADIDEDGYSALVDCDDDDAEVNPGQMEVPDNGKDDNCDGESETTSTGVFAIDGQELLVYPNPVAAFLKIKLPHGGNYNISLMTIDGTILVHELEGSGDIEIRTSNLFKGFYLLKIESKLSGQIIIDKVIKL